MRLWHDMEKTIPALPGMTVAVAEGMFIQNGKALDLIQPNPHRRPIAQMKNGKLGVFFTGGDYPYRADNWLVARKIIKQPTRRALICSTAAIGTLGASMTMDDLLTLAHPTYPQGASIEFANAPWNDHGQQTVKDVGQAEKE